MCVSRKRLKNIIFALLCAVLFCFTLLFSRGNAWTASASADAMSIDCYQVDVTIGQDRKVQVQEIITMTPNRAGSVFTRSLPLEGDRYSDLTVQADGSAGESFDYSVQTSESDEFLEVRCKLPSVSGQTRVFRFSYTMLIGELDAETDMILDVIGYGWGVALHNVTVTVHFPENALDAYTLYSGGYGASGNEAGVTATLSADKKTLVLTADTLKVVYNDYYGERMAQGITLDLRFANGSLRSHFNSVVFSDRILALFLIGVAVCAIAVTARVLTRKKRDIVPVINVKAPDKMDPLKMGKLLDGNVDAEDVTSMIYYFADQGFLTVNLQDEKNPVLIRNMVQLPAERSVYEHTLFNGLFKSGDSVTVAQLQTKFYQDAEKATKQVPTQKMYEKRSVVGFLSGAIAGLLFAFLSCLVIGLKELGGYFYGWGAVFGFPILGITVLTYIRENYRYKWKKPARFWTVVATYAVAVVSIAFFTAFCAEHLLSVGERFLVALFAFLPCFITAKALSRTQEYCETLGEILGFKEFIVATEQDRIKEMLEINPALYFKVLPYAQVLGVTDEWENKFKGILIQPPTWYVGGGIDVFDYLILRRCMRVMARGMMMRPAPKSNGSFTGSSGGGGFFGGFGGGGHGGGGGSWS